MKRIFSLCVIIVALVSGDVFGQTPISLVGATVQDFSSETGKVASNAIDVNPSTFWSTGQNSLIPAFIEVDLGSAFDIDGFSYTPKVVSNNNKPLNYEIYLSTDGVTWGDPESEGTFTWLADTDLAKREFFFGAISAQYVKVVYLDGTASHDNIQTSEIEFYQSVSAPTGQENQTLSINKILDKYSTNVPFTVSSVSSTNMVVTYSVVSGPATIVGNTVTLTGAAGTVKVKAEQVGDATYYPVSTFHSFEVIDLSVFVPTIGTRLTSDFPIEMPSLLAYPIYLNSSIAHPDSLGIDSIVVEIDGQSHLAEFHNSGYFYYMWTPSSFGAHTINLKSHSSNGKETSLTKNVVVTNTINSQNVTTLDEVNITLNGTNSRWYTGTYTMPQHVGAYDNATANLTIACPATTAGCDDWDRYAFIDIKAPDGNWIQIIRYNTPYGVACNHTIDLTDYASLLQGEFEFRMFIDTWGSGGWLATLDFDFQVGTPEYAYSMVDEIWDGTYNFGNLANLQPLDTVNYTFPLNVQYAKLSMSNTGHGWGQSNSQNAAEFYHTSHFVYLNGVNTFTHDLWNDCNPTPDNCSGQAGTWQYSRAGWCPGAIAPPTVWDLTSHISSGVELIYQLDPTYTDFCHPNNPSCISGTSTCLDCNDDFNPNYKIDAHVISYSNLPLLYDPQTVDVVDISLNYQLEVYPNPVSSYFKVGAENIDGEFSLIIYTIEGQGLRTYYFKSIDDLRAKTFDVSNFTPGSYFVNIANKYGEGTKRLIIK